MSALTDPTLVLTGGSLIGLIVITASLLRAWHGWLDLKRRELDRAGSALHPDERPGLPAARIELADLKERIRKLEAIASGVEL